MGCGVTPGEWDGPARGGRLGGALDSGEGHILRAATDSGPQFPYL